MQRLAVRGTNKLREARRVDGEGAAPSSARVKRKPSKPPTVQSKVNHGARGAHAEGENDAGMAAGGDCAKCQSSRTASKGSAGVGPSGAWGDRSGSGSVQTNKER